VREAKQRVSQDPPDDGLVGQGGGNKTCIKRYHILFPHVVTDYADHDPWAISKICTALRTFHRGAILGRVASRLQNVESARVRLTEVADEHAIHQAGAVHADQELDRQQGR
jgi:hypothetical protein